MARFGLEIYSCKVLLKRCAITLFQSQESSFLLVKSSDELTVPDPAPSKASDMASTQSCSHHEDEVRFELSSTTRSRSCLGKKVGVVPETYWSRRKFNV